MTGLLIHQGDRFYGVLEGPRRRVLAAHGGHHQRPAPRARRILREEAVAERRFENWTFGALPDPRAGGRPREDFIRSLGRGLK